MKLVRSGAAGKKRPDILDASGEFRDVSNLTKDWSGEALEIAHFAQASQVNLSALPVADKDRRIGCPIARPGKMACVGLNDADHAAKAGFDRPDEPLVFFKSRTALSGPFDPIIPPRTATAVDWEVEAVLIGAIARNVQPDEAMSVVAGFALVNDVTHRQWQFERGGQWGNAKSADTFAPRAPFQISFLLQTDKVGGACK